MSERYAAFLRGISPLNCSMPALKKCLEAAGFTDVRTLLSSGNAVFTTRSTSEQAILAKVAKAFATDLGEEFPTFLRSTEKLREIIEADYFAPFKLPAHMKRVVTFLHEPPPRTLKLPPERDGARMLCIRGRECFSAYLPGPQGPVFMTLIERTFGKQCTTRTLDTVRKVAAA